MKRIASTYLQNQENPDYKTSGGEITSDYIFLLSIQEISKYYQSADYFTTTATEYAKQKGIFVADNGCSLWWLRSPGHNGCFASYIHYYGSRSDYFVNFLNGGVRPAFWINIDP